MMGFKALTMLGKEIKGYRISLKILGLMGHERGFKPPYMPNKIQINEPNRSTKNQEEIYKIETQAFPLCHHFAKFQPGKKYHH